MKSFFRNKIFIMNFLGGRNDPFSENKFREPEQNFNFIRKVFPTASEKRMEDELVKSKFSISIQDKLCVDYIQRIHCISNLCLK